MPCRAGSCPAVPCRALPCPACALPVPCRAVRCCAMQYRAACFLLYFSYTPNIIRSAIPPVLLLLYVPGTILSNHKINVFTAQFIPAIAQQRSAVPCSAVRYCAVPCLALRCCSVLRCAFFGTYSSSIRYHAEPGTDRYVCLRVYSSFFTFFI